MKIKPRKLGCRRKIASFRDRLAALIPSTQLTNVKICEILKIDTSTLHRWLNGEAPHYLMEVGAMRILSAWINHRKQMLKYQKLERNPVGRPRKLID